MQKGTKHSLESRALMSAAMKGNPAWNKGRPRSLKTKKKLSLAMIGNKHAIGYKHSPEAKIKISVAKKGKKKGALNHRWLGGVSILPYAFSFNAELKEEVRRRDGHKCQLCGVPQAECVRALSVHHIDYDKKNSDPVNLISLCGSCHARTNTNRAYWTAFFLTQIIEAMKKNAKETVIH